MQDSRTPFAPEDLPRIIALDRAATGEDRRHLLEALPDGWLIESGYALHGGGVGGLGDRRNSASGEALLSVLSADSPEPEVTVRVPRSIRTCELRTQPLLKRS